MVVRRARLAGGGDVGAWFEAVRTTGTPVRLADAGVATDPVVAAGDLAWRFTGDAGVVIEPSSVAGPPVAPEIDAATRNLGEAAGRALEVAGDAAPPLWTDAVGRALAILASGGTGEELSDVAWPHFLLPEAAPLAARRLAAAAASLWLWEGPGAWSGERADRAHAVLHAPVGDALVAAVDESARFAVQPDEA